MARFARYVGLVGLLLAAFALGCTAENRFMLTYPHAKSVNLAQSSEEHYHSVSRIAKLDRKALVDDLDTFFMTDRPTRLTRWHPR